MKIAIATFADLPSPPVKGGAVETLIDIICQINEKKKKIDIDLFSIADKNAEIKAAPKRKRRKCIPDFKVRVIIYAGRTGTA